MPGTSLDACPRCRTDVSRRVGLITTPTVACPKCRAAVDVSPQAVVSNWQFSIGVLAGVFLWTALAVAVFISPEFAASAGGHLRRPVRTTQDRLILALFVGVPAGVVSIPFGLIGRVLGGRVARRLATARGAGLLDAGLPRPAADAPPAAARHRVRHRLFADVPSALTGGGASSAVSLPAVAPPRGRIRVAAVLAWAGVFAGAGTLALAALAAAGADGDAEAWRRAAEDSLRTWTPAVAGGAVAAAALLGGTGLLPGTRRKAA